MYPPPSKLDVLCILCFSYWLRPIGRKSEQQWFESKCIVDTYWEHGLIKVARKHQETRHRWVCMNKHLVQTSYYFADLTDDSLCSNLVRSLISASKTHHIHVLTWNHKLAVILSVSRVQLAGPYHSNAFWWIFRLKAPGVNRQRRRNPATFIAAAHMVPYHYSTVQVTFIVEKDANELMDLRSCLNEWFIFIDLKDGSFYTSASVYHYGMCSRKPKGNKRISILDLRAYARCRLLSFFSKHTSHRKATVNCWTLYSPYDNMCTPTRLEHWSNQIVRQSSFLKDRIFYRFLIFILCWFDSGSTEVFLSPPSSRMLSSRGHQLTRGKPSWKGGQPFLWAYLDKPDIPSNPSHTKH